MNGSAYLIPMNNIYSEWLTSAAEYEWQDQREVEEAAEESG